jgi:hypothetical protein
MYIGSALVGIVSGFVAFAQITGYRPGSTDPERVDEDERRRHGPRLSVT